MATGRKICLALSIAVIAMWLLAFIPEYEYLPQPVYAFLRDFHSILTVLQLPAFVGVWLCPERRPIANKVAAIMACAFVAFQAFATLAVKQRPILSTNQRQIFSTLSVFCTVLFGVFYFVARLGLMLFREPKSKLGGIVSNTNAA